MINKKILLEITFVILLFAVTSCKTKESIVEREVTTKTKVDSTYKRRFDSLYTVYQSEVASYKEYTKIIETQLQSYIKGTTGSKPDTLTKELKKQHLLLTSGKDTFIAKGKWTYFDYNWYNAPCENVYESTKDSLQEKETYYKSVVSSLRSEVKTWRKRYESLNKKKKKTIKVINWKWTISGWVVSILLVLFLVFRNKIL